MEKRLYERNFVENLGHFSLVKIATTAAAERQQHSIKTTASPNAATTTATAIRKQHEQPYAKTT